MARDFGSELGIQTWCFRSMKEHERVIEALKACGVDRAEMSGFHFDPTGADADPAALLRKYRPAGITISTYGVHTFGADESKGRQAFELARLAGFPSICSNFAAGGVAVAEKLCKEYGKKVATHNHGRHHRYGPVWALEELFGQTSPNVGLCLDTAWMLDSGENPVEMAKRFRRRLYGLHLKDFVFDRAGRPEDVVVGTGNLDLDALTRFLVETDYDGFLTVEYEGDVDNPIPATRKCVEAIRASFAKARA